MLEDRRRLEHHHPARRDRPFLAGLGIAPDALALLAHHEGAERGKLHGFATLQAVGDFFEHQLHERRGFRPRKTYFLVDRFAEVRPRHCFTGHRPPCPWRRYPAELSTILASSPGVNGAIQINKGYSAGSWAHPRPW